MYPRVSVHIVAWNSMGFLPDLLKSIFSQTYEGMHVMVVDNGSDDGAEAFIRANYPRTMVLRNVRNLGFATAHNQAIRYAIEHWNDSDLSDRFVLVANPDTIWSPTFLEELVRAAEQDPKAGSFQGKLLRAYREHGEDEALAETVRSERIDSTGLSMHRDRTVTDRGAGELDTGQHDPSTDVFGPTGALALYRASALQGVRDEDGYFDPDFFVYKEDVDLAWRLRRAGWTSRYVPGALAHHHRNMFGTESAGWMERIRNRRSKSPARNWYSTRNQLLLLAKNEPFWSGLLALPWIVWFEARRFAYVCLLEPSSLSAYFSAARLFPRMFLKRFRSAKQRI